MKVVFLDIDGVLVTRRLGVFEEPLLLNLKRIIEETGATIILSSDWRRHPAARFEASRVLATVGLKFISCTPAMSAYIAQRPTEIMQAKKDHNKRGDVERIGNWVAIDDRALLEERHGSYLQGHFVQTHPLRGITDETVSQCVDILNKPEPVRAPGPLESTAIVGDVLSRDGLAALGNSMRAPAGSRARGSSTPGRTAPLGGPSGAKRGTGLTQGLAALGPGIHSFGLAETAPAEPHGARMPSVARQRGRSTGAPPIVGSRRG